MSPVDSLEGVSLATRSPAPAGPQRPLFARRSLLCLVVRSFCLQVVAWLCLSGSLAPLVASEPSATVRIGRPAGVARYWNNTWGVVGVDATNPTDRPAEVLASLYFDTDPTMQYARRLWVPPHAVRHSWFPVFVPALQQASRRSTITIRGNGYDVADGRQIPLPNPAGRRLQSDVLEYGKETLVTGVLSDQGYQELPQVHDFAFEAIGAMHRTGRAIRRIQEYRGFPLPPLERALDGLDHLVISHNQLTIDWGGTIAIRRWLHRGGILWIMLDRVDDQTVGRLLGDSLDLVTVGRVDLTQTDLRTPGGEAVGDQPFELVEPVPFVHVLLPEQGVQVVHTQDGWPASFWVRAGKGKVLFTSIGPQAWIRSGEQAAPDVSQPPEGFGFGPVDALSAVQEPATHHASQPLAQLAADFLEAPAEPLLAARELKSFLDDEIGYQVVARWVVLLVLGVFSLGLPIISLGLDASRKRDWLVWLVPSMAVTAAGILVFLGAQSRRAIPPTVAMVQLVDAAAGTNELIVDGLLAIYSQQQVTADYRSRRGGVFLPNFSDLGQTRRVVWTGVDQWQWENVTLTAASVRMAPFRSVVRTDQPLKFIGSFDAQGFVGTFRGEGVERANDAVLVVPGGDKWRVRFQPNGSGTLGADDAVERDAYLSGGLVSERQRRRQSVYRQLFARADDAGFPDEPTLLVWTPAFETHFVFPPHVEQTGSALLAIPVELETPAAGSRVLVPGAFLRCRSVPGPGLRAASSLYNHRTASWITSRRASQVWLRFELPPSVRSLHIEQATIAWKVTAPGWHVRLSRLVDATSTLVAERTNRSEPFTLAIDRDELLDADPAGGIVIGLEAEPVADQGMPEQRTPWKVDFLRLRLSGRMPD